MKFNKKGFTLLPAGGQGNHLTYLASNEDGVLFLRLENGPEGDDYMEIETKVMDVVRTLGVPVPKVLFADATRTEVPFAYQIMEYVDFLDLNKLYKNGDLDLLHIAEDIGKSVDLWQTIRPTGYGPFNLESFRTTGELTGLHHSYNRYFLLNWEKHLNFLVKHNFLSIQESALIDKLVKENYQLLELESGCLVHKDLALWNVLGLSNEIKAFIDWDDAISGDFTDDLSLLACYHSKEVVEAAMMGYGSIRCIPQDFFPRFYLHLLRNMIVKAVIRVGSNYFDKSDDFFLIDTGSLGSSLQKHTKDRIFLAYRMLKDKVNELIL